MEGKEGKDEQYESTKEDQGDDKKLRGCMVPAEK